jgi:thioredoxin-related protein
MKNAILFLTLFFIALNTHAEEALSAGLENPGFIEKPTWFKNSFLDIREDLEEATEENKRLLLYFHQDGCPYCEKLIKDNFGNKVIANKTQKYFDVIEINMWGDKEVVSFDGKELSEKAFAKSLKIQYTPSILMLDKKGDVVLRINGYYHPDKFTLALDYVGKKLEEKLSYREFSKKKNKATYQIVTTHNNIANSKNLKMSVDTSKPTLVIFEDTQCKHCTELHKDILNRPASLALLKQLNVITYDMHSKNQLITPSGELTTWAQWSKKLDVKYAPGLFLFDADGKEIIRTEGYLRTFHVQTTLEYAISGGYKTEPEFQRFVEARAERMREQGLEVDIMK